MTDTLYQDPKRANTPFQFDTDVVAVFDDMLHRSIPHYLTIQDMLRTLVLDRAFPHTTVYDFGCSTGYTLCHIAPELSYNSCIGIDLSPEMLVHAERRRCQVCPDTPIQWVAHDLNTPAVLKPSSVIILNLCYQFIKPAHKSALLDSCYSSLLPRGTLIVVEKILAPHSPSSFQRYYECFKRSQGYTDQEISGKKKALQTVLHSVTPDVLTCDLERAGFQLIESFFQWFNFIGLLSQKPI